MSKSKYGTSIAGETLAAIPDMLTSKLLVSYRVTVRTLVLISNNRDNSFGYAFIIRSTFLGIYIYTHQCGETGSFTTEI